MRLAAGWGGKRSGQKVPGQNEKKDLIAIAAGKEVAKSIVRGKKNDLLLDGKKVP